MYRGGAIFLKIPVTCPGMKTNNPSIHLPVYPPTRTPAHPHTHTPHYLPTYLPTSPSIYLPTYLPTYLSISFFFFILCSLLLSSVVACICVWFCPCVPSLCFSGCRGLVRSRCVLGVAGCMGCGMWVGGGGLVQGIGGRTEDTSASLYGLRKPQRITAATYRSFAFLLLWLWILLVLAVWWFPLSAWAYSG